MFHWITARLAACFNSIIAAQRAEIARQRRRIEHFERRVDGLMERADALKADRDGLLAVVGATLGPLGFEHLSAEWRSSPELARAAVIEATNRMLAAERRRAAEAQSAADDLRKELRDAQRALETEQRAHELSKHEAKCIGEENRLLAKIHETDIARRSAERALQVRREAEAEVATDALRGEERE